MTIMNEERCDTCGSNRIYHGPPDCPTCGAPNCCQMCCRVTTLEAERDNLRQILKDQCDDEDAIKKKCEGVLTSFQIHGDSYCAHGVVDVVNALLKLLADLRAERDALTKENTALRATIALMVIACLMAFV